MLLVYAGGIALIILLALAVGFPLLRTTLAALHGLIVPEAAS